MRRREDGGSPAIDLFRLAAAILVTAIHTSPLAAFTPAGEFFLTSVLARLAVPFFFMTSGFFTVTRYARDRRALWAFEKRTALMYLLATLLYLPVNIRNGYFSRPDLAWELIRDILFDGTFYHLWYLPAAALGAAIAWALIRKTDYPCAFAVTGALGLVCLFGDSWFGAAPQAAGPFYSAVFRVMDRTRGGVFMAPLYFVLGAALRDTKRRPSRRVSAWGFMVTLVLMTGEALTVAALGWARYYTVYLTLPACSFFLFALLLTVRGGRVRWARSAALALYIVHPLAIIAVRAAARALGLWGTLVDNSAVHFLAVCALSTAASFPAAAIFERLRPKRAPSSTGRAWRELDIPALEYNVRALGALMPPDCSLMAVVKANAYGHGDFEVSRELDRLGVRAWAVATVDEGAALRSFGVHGQILVLGYTPPERAWELRRHRLTQTVISEEYAKRLDSAGVKLRVHLKLDTGMHRLGVPWDDIQAAAGVFDLKRLRVTGVYTHLSCSELRDGRSREETLKQDRRFRAALRGLEERGLAVPPCHIQSTYGLLNYPELSRGFIRAGLGIYGVLSSPDESTTLSPDLRPVLSVRARVALVRSVPEGEGVGYGGPFRTPGARRIAILPVGYADGVPRTLSGGTGYVLLHGRRAPVVGAVCMDQMAVDVTDIPEAAPGDAATLIGRDGEETLSAPAVAALAGTITNELLSRLGARLPTVLHD